MEAKWQLDNLFNGMTGNAIKLGTALTLGWFWVRPSGCNVVYRGQDGDVDFDSVLAVMDIDDLQIAIDNQFLQPNSIWHYVRCQVGGCGLESDPSPACVVTIDEAGDILGKMPNVPYPLQAKQIADGKIQLRWRYPTINQEVTPTGFNIYMDSGSGFDFSTAIDTVDYKMGRDNEFTWLSDALNHGQIYRFTVRSYYATGAETRNTEFAAAIADSVGPPAITGITASWQEDQ